MKKTIKPYLTSLFILFFATACENDVQVVNSITQNEKQELPAESSENVEFLYSDSAKVKSKLSAKQLDRYVGENPYFEMTKGMEVVFYTNFPQIQTKLTAEYGIGKNNGESIETLEAQRNVIVINEKGEKLNTEHLTWNGVTKKIYTDKFVKITTQDEVIWGDGLEANEDFSEYEITHVKGQIYIKDSIQ